MSPADRDVTRLVPIILPPELLAGGWPGPIVPIGQLPFAMAWAVRGDMNSFVYVSHEQAAFWQEAGLDWRKLAFENLRDMSTEKPAWGEKLDDDGRPFFQVLLHDDAIGPSRLLVPHLFDDVFGPDYLVAIPERTCAVVYRTDLTPEQSADVEGMISGCYEHGTEPMSPERFKPQDFWCLAEANGFAGLEAGSPPVR